MYGNHLVPQEQPESDIAWKLNQNEDSTTKSSDGNEVYQSELKQNLAIVRKYSKVNRVFEENQCSGCLSNCKEIFENDLHIIIPYCGHLLCCESGAVVGIFYWGSPDITCF